MSEFKDAVVVDLGADTIRAGIAGEEEPKVTFPCVVGSAPQQQAMGDALSPHLVGDDAIQKRGVYHLNSPISSGCVTNWQEMELIWQHMYDKLGVAANNQPTVFLDSPGNSVEGREKLVQTAFEKFAMPATWVACQAVTALYATGRVTGLVVDSGLHATYIHPVYEGYTPSEGRATLPLGGVDLTASLAKVLAENGHTFTAAHEADYVRQMKEAVCYVAPDFPAEMSKAAHAAKEMEKKYDLPDGKSITVASERFMCPEVLFKPSYAVKQVDHALEPLHEVIKNSIMACEVDMRKAMAGNLMLAGGNTLFPGFAERVKKEVQAKMPTANLAVKVLAKPERRIEAWIGASVMTSLATMDKNWITKAEFDEHGPSIVRKKCF